MIGRAIEIVRPVLIDKVERDHWQSDAAFLRRRIVVAVTLALGGTLLAFPSHYGRRSGLYPVDLRFGCNLGARQPAVGPLHLGHILRAGRLRRPTIIPIAVGLLLAGLFVVGALIVRRSHRSSGSPKTCSATHDWETSGSSS